MANNRLGEIRRSAAVMTFGPGSVVDFRADGAPVSAVPAGLEEWDANSSAPGLTHKQQISEPRLQRKLSVGGFRLPPVVDDDRDRDTLVAVRFPEWLQCPQCDRIALASRWMKDPGRAYRYCAHCTHKMPGQRKVFAVPVRFVMACAKGHLDEFPWHRWVRHKDDCHKRDRADLYLRSERPGLAGLILSCRECKARRSMDSVFSAQTWRGVQCRGRRPWLAANDEQCESEPRALQRGASNIYFPVMESALSIPPWSDVLQEALGLHWNTIVDTKPQDRSALIQILARNVLKRILSELNLSPEDLERHIQDRLTQYNDDAILNIRQEEYRQFTLGTDTTVGDAREFEVRNVPVPDRLRPFLSRVVRAVRLREVRALKGFTRINPPGDDDSSEIASISVGRPDWLPAIEVRGEGIFLAFNQETLRVWEMRDRVVERALSVHRAWRNEWKQRYGDEPAARITPRYLLAHTFAHALMRQLTLVCGYSTAALRERLYVSDGDDGMAGLLIYTATSDSDGTLGGLQRQGEAPRIESAVEAAIRAMEWCSSDPLCIERALAGSDRLSLAACHACVLAPETACEEYNRFLDRAALIGLPSVPGVGFFSPLIQS